MKTNFRERFLNNLTDTACEIMKRYANGETITDNQLIFLQIYLRELRRYEYKPLPERLIESSKPIVKFVKENFSGLLTSGESGVDDYVINTNMNLEDI